LSQFITLSSVFPHYPHKHLSPGWQFLRVQASERFMVVTVKHSGSLVTLSGHGFAAKNSVGNTFTAGKTLFRLAAYDRFEVHNPHDMLPLK
jgi:hypothetical protein